MKPVIEVRDISKSYQISHQTKASYNTIKDDFAKLIKRPFGGSAQEEYETFWALKNISFEVQQGESFGIIGKNGSGKSTLLKILSRIVDPTTGSARIHGKVASMLEVGTGFHPELTGRENIYFNGSMIGMSKKEIARKFNEIVDFSGVEQFLDTPVKFYSSGMYVRLAFSVAAHLDSEILIIDEVLAVGDAAFQKKSLAKMNSIIKEGRTIVFVSHSMPNVKQLCNKALLLEKGRIKYIGETEFVTDKYLSKSMPPKTEKHFKQDLNKDAQFTAIQILDQNGKEVEAIDMDIPWMLKMAYKVSKPCPGTIVVAQIVTLDGQIVYFTSDGDDLKRLRTKEPGTYEVEVNFNNIFLNPGMYYLRCSIEVPGKKYHDLREDIPLNIRVNKNDVRTSFFGGKYLGFISNKTHWHTTRK